MLVIFAMALPLSMPKPNRVDAFSRHRITPVLSSCVSAFSQMPPMFNVLSARCLLLLVTSALENCNGNGDSAKLGSGSLCVFFRFPLACLLFASAIYAGSSVTSMT